MKQRYILFILLFQYFNLSAQGKVHLLFNKPFYVSGETIWYTFYLTPEFEGKECVFQATIAKSDGEIVQKYSLQNEGERKVSSFFQLPYELESAQYQFLITANGKKKEKFELLKCFIPIYNDLIIKATTTENVFYSNEEVKTDLTINIDLLPTYGSQSQVRSTIKVLDGQGNPVEAQITVSVFDQSLHGSLNRFACYRSQDINTYWAEQISDKISLIGTVKDQKGMPIRLGVLGAFSASDNQVYYTSSSDDGGFQLNLPEFYEEKELQFLGYKKETEIIQVDLENQVAAVDPPPLIYNKEIINYLDLSRKRKKIYQYFGTIGDQLETRRISKRAKELKPDFSFDFSEYEDFDDVASFFRELLTPLKFELQKDSTYTSYMINPAGSAYKNTYLSGQPLFIIDGLCTKDADFVGKLAFKNIESVDLFFKPENIRPQFNAIGMSGVALLETNLPYVPLPAEDAQNIFVVNGFQNPGIFLSKDNTELPQLQPAIYWNPDLKSDNKGITQINFDQYSDPSIYTLMVTAIDANGRIALHQAEYQIEF